MTIKVTVRSGMVEDVDGIPTGVDVEINDYDITPAGDEELEADSTMEQDSDGDWYQIQGWAGSTLRDALTQMLRRVVFAYFDNANGRYDLPEAMEDAAKLLDIRLGNCAECGDWAIVSDPGLCERCEDVCRCKCDKVGNHPPTGCPRMKDYETVAYCGDCLDTGDGDDAVSQCDLDRIDFHSSGGIVPPVTAEQAVSEALDYFTDQIDGREVSDGQNEGEQGEIRYLQSLRDGLQIAKEALS